MLLACLLLALTIGAQAQTYRTERLKRAAEVVGLRIAADSLLPEHTYELMSRDGRTVCVRTSPMGIIEHVGIPLFNKTIRVLQPSPVYDFLEYAVLNWKYKAVANQLYLSRVIFKHGSWETLLREQLDQCVCSIINQQDKLYVVTWTRTSQSDTSMECQEEEVAVIGIPIDYELLNNDTRRNMERMLITELMAYHPIITRPRPPFLSAEALSIYGTEGLFVHPGRSYIIDQLNQNVYYRLTNVTETVDTIIDGHPATMSFDAVWPVTLRDRDFPIETFANLMMCDDTSVPDVTLDLDIHLSNYHRQRITMPLSHLKAYCRQEGSSLFFASDGVQGDKAKGLMFVCNLPKGYNHLFSLRMPADELTSLAPVVQADVYLYIPPLEKTKLFGTAPTKKSGANFKLP